MSMIDSIASASTAMSQAKLQSEMSMRVLKMAQAAGQPSAELLESAMETAQEIISQIAEGGQLDTTA
jgi:hypothetical protein